MPGTALEASIYFPLKLKSASEDTVHPCRDNQTEVLSCFAQGHPHLCGKGDRIYACCAVPQCSFVGQETVHMPH